MTANKTARKQLDTVSCHVVPVVKDVAVHLDLTFIDSILEDKILLKLQAFVRHYLFAYNSILNKIIDLFKVNLYTINTYKKKIVN